MLPRLGHEVKRRRPEGTSLTERNGELPQTRTGARQEARRNKRLLSRMATQSM
jgi:hypothetical protein